MPEILDAAAIRRWSEAALEGLAQARIEIDDINVYPVPDGDTGTNLFLTMEAAAAAVREVAGEDFESVLRALADGAFIGAKGNSGVITSQLLRGLADELIVAPRPDGSALASALEIAADLGYSAVAEPVEGTILTVARAAANAARVAVERQLGQVATAAVEGAAQALAKTPEQLGVLRKAGVVDAGGQGLCVILAALAEVITGLSKVVGLAPALSARRSRSDGTTWLSSGPDVAGGAADPESDLWSARRAGQDSRLEGPSYEVMYLLDAVDSAIPQLKRQLGRLGDSLVVVGGGGRWNVHVHVNEPGPAVEAGVAAGRPHRINITNLREAAEPRPAQSGPRRSRPAREADARRAVVALMSVPGLASVFDGAGATVVGHEPDRPPATGLVVEAINAAGASEVVVIADGEATVAVAEAASARARADGVRVAVIPARSCVQAIAALAVHDPAHEFDTDVIAMSGAAGAARHAEVTIAEGDAVTTVGLCRAGDVLGLIEGDVALIGSDVADLALALLDRMLAAGGELVTLVIGVAAPPGLGQYLCRRLHVQRPEIEYVVYDGEQASYPLLIGVE